MFLLVPVAGTMRGQTGAAPSSPRAYRVPFGSAPLALRSGALTARPRPGCGLGRRCRGRSSTRAALSIYSAASAVAFACKAVSIISITNLCRAFGRRWMRSICCRSLGAGPRLPGGDSSPIKSSTVTASV